MSLAMLGTLEDEMGGWFEELQARHINDPEACMIWALGSTFRSMAIAHIPSRWLNLHPTCEPIMHSYTPTQAYDIIAVEFRCHLDGPVVSSKYQDMSDVIDKAVTLIRG